MRKSMKNFNFLKSQGMRRIFWLGFALLFLGLFVKISWELHEDSALDSLDKQILVQISKFRVSALNGSAVDITALGSPTVLTLFTIVVAVLLWLNKDRIGCAYLVVGSAGAGAGTFFMKRFFSRPRPDIVPRLVEVSGFSYPSGHSLGATSFFLLLMFLAWRHFQTWRARFIILICTAITIGGVCFSRLYLGVHYPSDVLSGMLLGAAWVFLLTAYFSRGEKGHE
jgi:undecaprenyl-diphosphatase